MANSTLEQEVERALKEAEEDERAQQLIPADRFEDEALASVIAPPAPSEFAVDTPSAQISPASPVDVMTDEEREQIELGLIRQTDEFMEPWEREASLRDIEGVGSDVADRYVRQLGGEEAVQRRHEAIETRELLSEAVQRKGEEVEEQKAALKKAAREMPPGVGEGPTEAEVETAPERMQQRETLRQLAMGFMREGPGAGPAGRAFAADPATYSQKATDLARPVELLADPEKFGVQRRPDVQWPGGTPDFVVDMSKRISDRAVEAEVEGVFAQRQYPLGPALDEVLEKTPDAFKAELDTLDWLKSHGDAIRARFSEGEELNEQQKQIVQENLQVAYDVLSANSGAGAPFASKQMALRWIEAIHPGTTRASVAAQTLQSRMRDTHATRLSPSAARLAIFVASEPHLLRGPTELVRTQEGADPSAWLAETVFPDITLKERKTGDIARFIDDYVNDSNTRAWVHDKMSQSPGQYEATPENIARALAHVRKMQGDAYYERHQHLEDWKYSGNPFKARQAYDADGMHFLSGSLINADVNERILMDLMRNGTSDDDAGGFDSDHLLLTMFDTQQSLTMDYLGISGEDRGLMKAVDAGELTKQSKARLAMHQAKIDRGRMMIMEAHKEEAGLEKVVVAGVAPDMLALSKIAEKISEGSALVARGEWDLRQEKLSTNQKLVRWAELMGADYQEMYEVGGKKTGWGPSFRRVGWAINDDFGGFASGFAQNLTKNALEIAGAFGRAPWFAYELASADVGTTAAVRNAIEHGGPVVLDSMVDLFHEAFVEDPAGYWYRNPLDAAGFWQIAYIGAKLPLMAGFRVADLTRRLTPSQRTLVKSFDAAVQGGDVGLVQKFIKQGRGKASHQALDDAVELAMQNAEGNPGNILDRAALDEMFSITHKWKFSNLMDDVFEVPDKLSRYADPLYSLYKLSGWSKNLMFKLADSDKSHAYVKGFINAFRSPSDFKGLMIKRADDASPISMWELASLQHAGVERKAVELVRKAGFGEVGLTKADFAAFEEIMRKAVDAPGDLWIQVPEEVAARIRAFKNGGIKSWAQDPTMSPRDTTTPETDGWVPRISHERVTVSVDDLLPDDLARLRSEAVSELTPIAESVSITRKRIKGEGMAPSKIQWKTRQATASAAVRQADDGWKATVTDVDGVRHDLWGRTEDDLLREAREVLGGETAVKNRVGMKANADPAVMENTRRLRGERLARDVETSMHTGGDGPIDLEVRWRDGEQIHYINARTLQRAHVHRIDSMAREAAAAKDAFGDVPWYLRGAQAKGFKSAESRLRTLERLDLTDVSAAESDWLEYVAREFGVADMKDAVGVYRIGSDAGAWRPSTLADAPPETVIQLDKVGNAVGAIRTEFLRLGSEAVELGLLKDTTFWANLSEYFPDLYKQHEKFWGRTVGDVSISGGASAKDIKLWDKMSDRFSKLAMEMTEGAERVGHKFDRFFGINNRRFMHSKYKYEPLKKKTAMGLIRDGRYTAAVGMAELTAAVENARFLKALKTFKTVDGNPIVMTADNPPDGWRQLISKGDLHHFGELEEAWAHPDVYRHLTRAQDVAVEASSLYSRFLAKWKWGKVVANPNAHLRNTLSNAAMAYWSGLSIGNTSGRRNFKQVLRALSKNEGQLWDEWLEAGGAGSSYLKHEIGEEGRRSIMKILAEGDDEAHTIGMKLLNVLKERLPPSAWVDNASDLYQAEELLFKLWKFQQVRNLQHNFRRVPHMTGEMIEVFGTKERAMYMVNGPEDAALLRAKEEAEKWFFDYSDIPDVVRWAKRNWAPFITYSWKALPRSAEFLMTHPIKAFYLRRLYESMNIFSEYMDGKAPDAMELENQAWDIQAAPFGQAEHVFPLAGTSRVPLKSGELSDPMRKLVSTQWLSPLGGFFSTEAPYAINYMPDWLQPSTPQYTLGLLLLANQHAHSAGEGRLVSPKIPGMGLYPDYIPDVAPSVLYAMSPEFIRGFGKVLSAARGESDYRGRLRTWQEAVAHSFMAARYDTVFEGTGKMVLSDRHDNIAGMLEREANRREGDQRNDPAKVEADYQRWIQALSDMESESASRVGARKSRLMKLLNRDWKPGDAEIMGVGIPWYQRFEEDEFRELPANALAAEVERALQEEALADEVERALKEAGLSED